MSIKAIESMSSSTSSSSSSISINTVSSLRHQFDNRIDTISLNTNNNNNNIHSNKPYGSNVNRLRSVFVPQSELAQQNSQKRQKFNNEEDSDDQQQQVLVSTSKTQHVSRSDNTKPTTEDIQTTTTTTTTKTNSNTNRSRSLSTPRITNKQIFLKSSEDYDKIESPSKQPSTTLHSRHICLAVSVCNGLR